MLPPKELIYISEPQEIVPGALSLLKDRYDLYLGNPQLEHLPSRPIIGLLIRSQTHVTSSHLDKFPQLKFIIRVGVGLDNVDVKACEDRHVAIYNSPGANANAVAEYVVGMMLTSLRHWHTLTPADLLSWNRYKFLGVELNEQTIGIVGFGSIGKLVYRKLASWGCKFIVYDPLILNPPHYFSTFWVKQLDDLLEKSTIITLHLPQTPSTHHLLSYSNLSLLQRNFILINSSRANIVDTSALLKILDEKQGLYIVDVYHQEPFVDQDLISSPRVITTPHIAAMTQEANRRMSYQAIESFLNSQLNNLSINQDNIVQNQYRTR